MQLKMSAKRRPFIPGLCVFGNAINKGSVFQQATLYVWNEWLSFCICIVVDIKCLEGWTGITMGRAKLNIVILENKSSVFSFIYVIGV